MFAFEARYKSGNEKQDLLVIFAGELESTDIEYASDIQRILKENLTPHGVILIYPEYLENEFHPLFLKDQRCRAAITRLGKKVTVDLYAFSKFGDLSHRKSIIRRGGRLSAKNLKQAVVAGGVGTLVERNKRDIVLRAPPGTVFSKPSGNTLEVFIKASELTRDYVEQQFLAYCLLSKFPKRRDVHWIYIDTASISAIIEALTYYLYRFSSHVCKRVRYRSFSSYSGVEKNKPKNEEHIWVIISASSSNGLGKQIAKDWNLGCDQVVTILSLRKKAKNGHGDDILFNMESSVDPDLLKNDLDSKTRVQVVGENFTAEVSEPKSILIKDLYKPDSINHSIRPFYNTTTFLCNKDSGYDSRLSPKPIYVVYDDLFKLQEDYWRWLERVVCWYTVSNMGWVVIQKGKESSEALLQHVQYFIEKNAIKVFYKVIDYSEVQEECVGNRAILVLDPVVSNGRSLLELNRSFRLSRHTGNRIFLTAFCTPASASEFLSFKNSLAFGIEGLKYQFLNYYQVCIGHELSGETWKEEASLCMALGNIDSKRKGDRGSPYWQSRAEKIQAYSGGLGEHIGQSLRGENVLGFTVGFAFWEEWAVKYKLGEVNQIAVLATMAAVLQELRDSKKIPKEEMLDSHVYQQAVIDPDNFTRFNDALLHACIWRCAESGELDYRRSEPLGEALVNILVNMMSSGYKSPRAESVVDLLIGFATRKIRVSSKQTARLVSSAKNCFRGNTDIQKLISKIER